MCAIPMELASIISDRCRLLVLRQTANLPQPAVGFQWSLPVSPHSAAPPSPNIPGTCTRPHLQSHWTCCLECLSHPLFPARTWRNEVLLGTSPRLLSALAHPLPFPACVSVTVAGTIAPPVMGKADSQGFLSYLLCPADCLEPTQEGDTGHILQPSGPGACLSICTLTCQVGTPTSLLPLGVSECPPSKGTCLPRLLHSTNTALIISILSTTDITRGRWIFRKGVHGGIGWKVRKQEEGIFALRIGASQVALVIKNPLPMQVDIRGMCLIPRLGRSSGGGHGNPLQYSCLGESHGQRSLASFSPYVRTVGPN